MKEIYNDEYRITRKKTSKEELNIIKHYSKIFYIEETNTYIVEIKRDIIEKAEFKDEQIVEVVYDKSLQLFYINRIDHEKFFVRDIDRDPRLVSKDSIYRPYESVCKHDYDDFVEQEPEKPVPRTRYRAKFVNKNKLKEKEISEIKKQFQEKFSTDNTNTEQINNTTDVK